MELGRRGGSESWRQRHRLLLFFGLAYLLSWYPCGIALLRGRTTGPNPFGPLLAAIIVAALSGGRSDVRTLLARLVRARVGWRWYLFVLAVPLLFAVLAAALTFLVTKSQVSCPNADKLRELPERFVFIFLFIGLGEEPGWRGFALPALQEKHLPLRASLILAPLWALWHLPLFGNEFPLPIVPLFVAGLFGATMVQTWLFNRTRGSVLLQMLFHAAVNTLGAGFIFPLFSGSALVLLWAIYAALWMGAGVCCCASRGGASNGKSARRHLPGLGNSSRSAAAGAAVLPRRAVNQRAYQTGSTARSRQRHE